MAIDTSTKRFSIMLDPGEMAWPPDGTIAAADRLVMLEFYSGIAATNVVPVTRSPTYRPGYGLPDSSYRPTAPAPPSSYRPNNPLPIGG